MKINLNVRVETELRDELNRVSEHVGLSRTELVEMALSYFREFGKINGESYGDVVQQIEMETGVLMDDYLKQMDQERANQSVEEITSSEVDDEWQELKRRFNYYDRLRGDFNG
jgi:DNA-directed RNA polymerase subunit F